MSRTKAALTPPETPPWAEALGQRLRDLRQGRRLSLADVSKQTGISTSFLSLFEKGQSDISLGRLLPLLEFYGVAAADVITWDGPSSDGVVRAGEAPFLDSVAKGIDLFLAASDQRRTLLPVIAMMKPGARMRQFTEHDGDEFIYVLEGSIRLDLRDAPSVVLNPGDAICFSGRRPHRVGTAGDDAARIMVVSSRPGPQ